jgi:hypothetical protein
MKYLDRYLLLVLLLSFVNSVYSQEKLNIYTVNLKLGAPIPLSGYTFKTYWCPSIDVNISGMKRFNNNLFAGLSFDYSLFHCRWIHQLKSSISIVNPNISIGYDIILSRRFRVFPDFSLGYSWFIFTNPVTPSKYLKTYNESGFSIKPGLSLSYSFKKNFCIGLTGSYKVIFTRFGIDGIILYEDKQEADFVSYLNSCVSFRKYF